ncbi:MAG: hypothetical protein V1783_06185, partial [Bacteroidota bacterium]
IDFDFICSRLIEQAIQKMRSMLEIEGLQNKKPVNILIFSTQQTEGKSRIQSAIAGKLAEFGFSVLSANYKLDNYRPKHSFTYSNTNAPIYYNLNTYSFNKNSVQDILGHEINTTNFDFVLVEIPSITHQAYPPGLIKDIDFGIVVTRSNRSWTKSDENSLNGIMQFMKFNPTIFLNGVQAETLEVLLGELPRKRSFFRRIIKKMVTLQFFQRNSLNK